MWPIFLIRTFEFLYTEVSEYVNDKSEWNGNNAIIYDKNVYCEYDARLHTYTHAIW